MSLQDRLSAFKADFENGRLAFKPAAEALATMHRATAELAASGQAGRAKKAGDEAPDFTLMDQDGVAVSLHSLLDKGPLVITFYRGAWCPYCNMELAALQAALPEITARGAQLVAISPQTAVNSRKAVTQNELTFPILSDPGGAVAETFGLRFALPEDLVALYKSFGNDLPTTNADPAWTLPMPGRFVVGTDGIIVYAEVNPDYTIRPDPSELLPVLDHAGAKAAA
jgi:peroxiredoxin